MKRAVGILILLVILPSFEPSPEYRFELAWTRPPHAYSLTLFKDLDGDGLSEILYLDKNKEENTVFTALDTVGNLLWSINVEKAPRYLLARDMDNDEFKEIFLVTCMTSRSEEAETHAGTRQIACYSAGGTLVWTHEVTVSPLWEGVHFERFKVSSFSDINHDGYDEIILGSVALDRHGTLLHNYGDDYSVIGSIDDELGVKFLLGKETDTYVEGSPDYTFCLRAVYADGAIAWEKQFSQPTHVMLEDVKGRKRGFLLQPDRVSEIDLATGEEISGAEFDFDYITTVIPPDLEVVDVDNDGSTEYVVTVRDKSSYGKGAIFVFDSAFTVVWSYTNHTFDTHVVDLDGDQTYEFCLHYDVYFSSCSTTPTFFQVLNYDTSERWTLLFDDYFEEPDFIDIDADGSTEIICAIDLEEPPDYSDMELEELLQALKDSMGEPSPQKENEYLYIFSSEGAVEKQIEVPFAEDRDFHDLDGDGDTDMFYHVKDEGIYVYTNTRFTGVLDNSSTGKYLADIDLGEAGFQRDDLPDPADHYEYKKMEKFFDSPFFAPDAYVKKMTILLSIPLVLGVGLSLFLTSLLKREPSDWQPMWGFKRTLVYFLWLFIPPLGLVYFGYKILTSDKDYKKALGFTRITLQQVFISLAVGVILLLVNWGMTYCLAINGVRPPTAGVREMVENYFVVAILLIVITAPVVEEILFSGYLYPLVRNRLGITPGIVLVSLIFAFLHLELALIPVYFVHAAIKTYAYERTHCMYVPMVIHFLNNALVVAVISLLLQ